MLSPAEIDRVLSAARLQSSLRATRANGSASQRAAAPNGRSRRRSHSGRDAPNTDAFQCVDRDGDQPVVGLLP